MKKMENQDEQPLWHALEPEAVFQLLHTSNEGLDNQEVKKRLKIFGRNGIQLKHFDTVPRVFLRQFHNPIVYVLLCSALLAFLIGKFTDCLVVFGAVVLNTLIGFIQEYQAHRTISALTSMIPHQTTVLRGGDPKVVFVSHLVPGDVVVLQPGDCIPADVRLFSLKNFKCDESILTGESLPVEKRIEACPGEMLVAERKCIAFNGTYVTSGSGLGVVIATGLKTEFGKISELIEQVPTLATPLSLKIKTIAKWITLGVLIVSFGLFLIGYLRGASLFDAGFAAITLAVAAIPEGLPAIITITSSIGVRRMARRQAIIRQLPAVEALGSTSVICTDKTGTLTYNEMTVQKIWTPAGFCFVSGAGYALEGEFLSKEAMNKEEITALLKAALLCNDASIDGNVKGWLPIGDPTEIALLVAGRKWGLQEEGLREEWQRKDVIPFESERRWMATLNATSRENAIFIKGAPEEILELCKGNINAESVHLSLQSMAKEGQRVLAIAKKEVPLSTERLDENEIKSGYTFLGLIGMIDPPRKEVYQALKSCFEAGITVKMVTGDHPVTAEAIGRDLGLLGDQKVMTGAQLSQLTPEEWKQAAAECQIFARISPEHKLKLVEALQASGQVVAMTGDGVNDAPALKRADIGISMGIKGTALAREASDMILADDNFASIEAAVEEGRRVYDNLIKSLMFVLPTSLGQALVIFFAVLFFPIHEGIFVYPLSPIQILWVNLVVAVALSLTLAFEAGEPDSMRRPPRPKKAPILGGFLLIKTITVSVMMVLGTIGLFLWQYHTELARGIPHNVALSEAQTIAVNGIMFFQVCYLFNCRSKQEKSFFSNRFIFIGVGMVFLAQIAFVYLPFMNRFFGSYSLNFMAWPISILVAFSIIPVIAIEKLMRKKQGS